MKVLYLIPHSPSAAGYATVSEFIEYAAYHRRTCEELSSRGIEVELCMLTNEASTHISGYDFDIQTYTVTTGSSFGWEISIGLIRHLNGGSDADVIHIHGYNQPNIIPYLATSVWSYPTIVHNHGSALDTGRFKHRIWYSAIRHLLSRCDAIVSVDQDELKNVSPLVGDGPELVHLPNGVDLERFSPKSKSECRDDLGLENELKYGLYVGRLIEEKGVIQLIEAFERLSKTDETLRLLLVYGGGQEDYIAKIKRKVEETGVGDKITMIGAVDHDRLSTYYNAADFCVFPSLSEGFGVVVLEAMACGTPVIASKEHLSGGHVRDGENCLVVDPQQPSEIVESVIKITNDEGFQNNLKENSRKMVSQAYTYGIMAEKTIDMYHNV